MGYYRRYRDEEADASPDAPEPEELYDADQVNADILDSFFAEEDDGELPDDGEDIQDPENGDLQDDEDDLQEPEEEFPESGDGELPWPEEAARGRRMSAAPEEYERQEGTTVITRGTTINGGIVSDCSLEVMGTINGDIECLGKLTICGKVTGNCMAAEVYVNTDRLEGSINSEGGVKIAQQTVIIGDITASSGIIAGAVKGEIDVAGPVVIDSTAVIQGNIRAMSIQMDNGAVLEGHVSLSYASGVDINTVFESK